MVEDKTGWIYLLTSPKSLFIKIGGSEYPPTKRVKEINNCEPYKSLGPWSLADFRQVVDWRKIESSIHYMYRSKLVTDIEGQKELFSISIQEAKSSFNEINSNEIVRKPKIDRMFQDKDFSDYILFLFTYTGLINWLSIQGAWTFVLFPKTSGGRYFTINIGPHEVAFSTLPTKSNNPIHMIQMDKLILDFVKVLNWISTHNGKIEEARYKTSLPRSVSVSFEATFSEVQKFLKLDGVRRALIAYWTEGLIGLKEKNINSTYARHHNWNAVAEINSRLQEVPE